MTRRPLHRSVRRALRSAHRAVLVRRARDVTESTTHRSALVFAPHPDDETLACGATIARKTRAGARVRVVIAADGGDEVRRAEAIAALSILGVHAVDVCFLGLRVGALAEDAAALDAAVAEHLDECSADDVFHPSPVDGHADHRALAAAVERCTRRGSTASTRLAYPVWYWTRGAWVDPVAPRWRKGLQFVTRSTRALVVTRTVVVRTADVAEQKRRAVAAHASQVGGPDGRGRRLSRSTVALFTTGEELFFVQSSKSR
jgi:LmbE family N-acetylglucosaminyl deacetylase